MRPTSSEQPRPVPPSLRAALIKALASAIVTELQQSQPQVDRSREERAS